MSASARNRAVRQAQREGAARCTLPPIACAHCGGAIVRGQNVGPLFSAKLVNWSEHPVLSKPVMLRGVIPADGSPGRGDLSLADQLRQRAAMGGDKERADLAAFETIMAEWIADALVAQLREKAAASGEDVWTWRTWLTRGTNSSER